MKNVVVGIWSREVLLFFLPSSLAYSVGNVIRESNLGHSLTMGVKALASDIVGHNLTAYHTVKYIFVMFKLVPTSVQDFIHSFCLQKYRLLLFT